MAASDTNYVNILFLNVRSLRNKLHDVYGLVQNRDDVGVVILGEVWIDSGETNFFTIPNFEAVFNCRDGVQGGGTVIYVRKDLEFRTLELDPVFNKILIEVTLEKQKIKIMTIYRPPSSNLNNFFEELERTCDSLKNVIIVGDINIDILNPTSTSVMYMNLLESYDYRLLNTITNDYATRCTSTSATIIDHVATDLPSSLINTPVDVTDTSISDHRVLTFSVSTKTHTKQKSTMMIKEFKRVDNSKFVDQVRQNTDEASNLSFKELIDIIRKAKELASTTVKKRVRKDSFVWMTLEILKLMEKRDKAYNRLVKNPFDTHIRQAYTEIKLKVKRKTQQAKSKHFHDKIMHSDNSKKLWAAINEEIGGTSTEKNKGISEIITEDGNVLTNKERIASCLNEYFVKYASTLRTGLNTDRLKNPPNPKTMFLKPISILEVKNEIMLLKTSSSPGIDQITNEDLKLIIDIIAPILTSNFNDCLYRGEFPDILKETVIIPIFKDGDRRKCNNYRPISLLPSIGKIFEKLLNKRLLDFINKTTKIDENQFGFQKNSSTDSALSQVINSLNKHLDAGQYVLMLFVDLRKAFDLVDHATLLSILEELGIRGNSLQIFRSYLSNRKVVTKVENAKSSELILENGVPQGSVLGPTLYLLYINSLRLLGTNGEQTIYADDTCFMYYSKKKGAIESQVKADLKKYFNWLDGQKLVINLTKTHYLVFRPKRKANIEIDLGDDLADIKRVESTKYLGVVFDEKLSWNLHISSIIKKVNPIIGAIRRCTKFPTYISQQVYNVHILSRIRSSLLIWSLTTEENLNKIQVLMNRSLKALYRLDWYTSLDELLLISNSFSLRELVQIERCKFIYKIRNNLIKTSFNLLRGQDIYRYPIRSRGNYRMITSRNNNLAKGILNSSQKEFNKLDDDIKNCNSIVPFNKLVKEYVRNVRAL